MESANSPWPVTVSCQRSLHVAGWGNADEPEGGRGRTPFSLLPPVVILSFLISLASDKTGWRGFWCIVAFGWSIILAGSLWGSVQSSQWVRYALFTLLSGGNPLAQGLNDSWLSINDQSKSNRSIGLALVVMGSNLGGLAGQQLFRSSDAPKYQSAFARILGLYGASILLTGVIVGVYWRANKRANDDVARCQL